MNDLVIDYHKLRDEAGRLQDLYLRLYDEISALTDMMCNLDIFWDGDANAAFMSSCGADLAQMTVIVKRAGETIRKCDKAVSEYLKNEKEVKTMIGELKR